MQIIFLGTSEFGAIVLETLTKASYKPFLVVTETDKLAGREKVITPPPVKRVAEKYKIPVVQPEKIDSCKEEFENLNSDLGIIASYGQILPEYILSVPQYGFINIHPSLLPRYRGPSPIRTAILNGDKKTGISIIRVSEEIDAGPILVQKEVEIAPKETYESLHNKLAETGAKMLLEVLPKIPKGKAPSSPQKEEEASYTKLFKKEDGRIDWNLPAETIERQVRAFNPWPGSYTFWKGKTLKILEVEVLRQTKNGPFGPVGKTYLGANNKIAVQTGKDFLVVTKLQLEGKKETRSEDFMRGYPNFIGTILG